VLVGSLRKESFSRKVALNLIALAGSDLALSIVEIGALPPYNPDQEDNVPATWAEFRKRVRPMDAVIFVTPEYNRSVPGLLKNAIDVGSRPYGQSVWAGKPAAVVSVSPGAIGGFGANHHLRQSLVFLGMPALQHEAYLGGVADWFDEKGSIKPPESREFLRKLMENFAAWIEVNLAKV
jgi:chromate reductase